jgi:hypothetical protein
VVALDAGGLVVTSDLRVVSPYRPFEPESQAHELLGPFDWVGALQMLRASVRRSCDCETVAITDVDTALPGPSFQFPTTARRLMLWILDVARCYLHSEVFDRDTIMLSPDLLVFSDLRPWMASGYFTVLMRAAYPDHPILNAVQFWPVHRKKALARFYDEAWAIAQTLEERHLRWGGDTEPLRQLLQPLAPGLVMRDGKPVAKLIESDEVLQSFSSGQIAALAHGRVLPPVRAIVDFRYTRKRYMRAYFEATLGTAVSA